MNAVAGNIGGFHFGVSDESTLHYSDSCSYRWDIEYRVGRAQTFTQLSRIGKFTSIPGLAIKNQPYTVHWKLTKYAGADSMSWSGTRTDQSPLYDINTQSGDMYLKALIPDTAAMWTAVTDRTRKTMIAPDEHSLSIASQIEQMIMEYFEPYLIWPETQTFASMQLQKPDECMLSPNPAVDRLTIHNGKLLSGAAQVSIVDAAGQVVKTFGKELKSHEQWSCDIASLNSGIYILRINAQNGSKTFKFIKL